MSSTGATIFQNFQTTAKRKFNSETNIDDVVVHSGASNNGGFDQCGVNTGGYLSTRGIYQELIHVIFFI